MRMPTADIVVSNFINPFYCALLVTVLGYLCVLCCRS
jgi:hypothetical protein